MSISLEKLQARSEQAEASAREATEKYNGLNDTRRELEETIRTATLLEVSPSDHAINKANLELLERSVTQLHSEMINAEAVAQTVREILEDLSKG